jgi:hypothetical protein
MASSTNYLWSEPDNTSLVKDGAQAMRTLGDAIDTSLWNSGFGQAGKNKVINGDFGIWQRGTSFTASGYTSDRFRLIVGNSTTVSRQTFTPATAPVAGYEGQFFLRLARTTSTTSDYITQKIEDVRTFAGQTINLSFWAKADAGATVTSVYFEQNFGSGGSAAVATGGNSPVLTTSWQRFSYQYAIPSISGKTVGTSSFLDLVFNFGSAMGNRTIDIWGVAAEYGSKATPFQTASGGSIQGELAMCQRYYFRTQTGTAYLPYGLGIGKSTTVVGTGFQLPVTMRVAPTSIDYANLSVYDTNATTLVTSATLAGLNSTTNIGYVEQTTGGGLTQYRPYYTTSGVSTAAYIGFSAEL